MRNDQDSFVLGNVKLWIEGYAKKNGQPIGKEIVSFWGAKALLLE